ncbi:hypothetical protein [Aeromonas veronii]|uniref:hypothetical protein n=1 Tax=Aeromonas veronii TaxID=654 RepID=UPI00187E9E54|nr:hypothetical protein [Aeromonas veronii]MBE8745240.1 hypothetical protein [Aeromonas veronii]
MKRNPILSEYKNRNKWVRIGVFVFAAGLSLLIACAGGLFYLWLTDFPSVGVPIPHWMSFCLFAGPFYIFIGVCSIAFGMEPPSGGGRRRNKNEPKRTIRECEQMAVVGN